MKKYFLTALILCSTLAVWADGWKFTKTTVYGAGGYWEDGQKTRIDCSYKNGVFQYERKVTEGKEMFIYHTNAFFSEPKQIYGPGEDLGVYVALSQSGTLLDYMPYARVTVIPQNPKWTKSGKASNQIPAIGDVEGQAIDDAGRYAVTPPDTVTLMARIPTSGEQMAIVYSCNGMDVVHLYKWDDEVAIYAEWTDEDDNSETWSEDEIMSEDELLQDIYDDSNEEKTLTYAIIIGAAVLLIGLILFLIRKKKKKEPVEDDFQQPEQPVAQQPANVCPNCGAPITGNERFCGNCGQKLL
jgi:LPXTG-motif cell wall-anchored protein